MTYGQYLKYHSNGQKRCVTGVLPVLLPVLVARVLSLLLPHKNLNNKQKQTFINSCCRRVAVAVAEKGSGSRQNTPPPLKGGVLPEPATTMSTMDTPTPEAKSEKENQPE